MARFGKLLTRIVVLAIASVAYGSAMAATFQGDLPVGYSESYFDLGQSASILSININAIGTRDPSICAFCNSAYTDNFTVNLFDQTGTLLNSANATNFLFYNDFTSSHGIGAGPVSFAVPAGATTLQLISQLSIAGLLGADGQPLSVGNLFIGSDGSIAAATPIPSFAAALGNRSGCTGHAVLAETTAAVRSSDIAR